MIRDFAWMALGNLTHRKLRSWLTILGVFIGILAIVSLISLSTGLKTAVENEFSKFGVDKILITPATQGGVGSSTSVSLGDGDLKRIEQTRGVLRVTPAYIKTGKVIFEKSTKFPQITGFSMEKGIRIIEDYGFLNVGEGRSLKKGDENKVIVGYNLKYSKLFTTAVDVGRRLLIEGKEFEIVGILKKTGDPGYDSGLVMTMPAFQDAFAISEKYDVIYAQTNKGEIPADVADRIKKNLRSYRNVDERKEDFSVQTSEDIAKSLFLILDIISAVLIGVAAISLLVGGINIMNTMYTAVLERTNEIGIMKATGATNSMILLLFVIESGMLGLVGGLIGLILGYGVSSLVAFIATQALGSTLIQAALPLNLVIGSLTFAFLIGAISGTFPAYRAAQMTPVDSLRY